MKSTYRHPKAKLSDDQVRDVRRRWEAKEARQIDMAAELGVSQSIISMICRGWLYRNVETTK